MSLHRIGAVQASLVSPAGFLALSHQPNVAPSGSTCGYCGERPGLLPCFTGSVTCWPCAQRRGRVARLLALIVRGETPEGLVNGPLAPAIGDELEQLEMEAHIDVLAAALSPRQDAVFGAAR